MMEVTVEQVVADRIIDGNGHETVWRGCGGSYLFHAGANYQQAWQQHLSELVTMGVNTVRLAFAFADSSPNRTTGGTPTADILDFAKMDWVLDFLNQHGIKGILDCHNYDDMTEDFGSQKLINDWVQVAQHYHGDARVAAYELFNEPFGGYVFAPSITSPLDGIIYYGQLTDAIRTVDLDHIVIWGAEWLYPDLADVVSLLRPNVVYTFHRWYSAVHFSIFSPEQLSYMSLAYAVEQRRKYGVPFWFGEFGSFQPFDSSYPETKLAEQSCWRCEEQVVGWNLWCGGWSQTGQYVAFFPLKVYNANLVRQPWNRPSQCIMDYITAMQGLDMFTPYEVQMWHNDDYITLQPGITVRYIRTQVVSGVSTVKEDVTVQVTQPLTLTNIEGTADYPGDWNMFVFLLPPTGNWLVLAIIAILTVGAGYWLLQA